MVESYSLLEAGKVPSEFDYQEAMETLRRHNLVHLGHTKSNSFNPLRHNLTDLSATQSMVTMDVITNLRSERRLVEVKDVNPRIDEDAGPELAFLEEVFCRISSIMGSMSDSWNLGWLHANNTRDKSFLP